MTDFVEVSVPEAASRLGISPDAVRSRIKRGTLLAKRKRGRVLVVLDRAAAHSSNDAVEPTNLVTNMEIGRARHELEQFSLHIAQLKRERDRLVEQTQGLQLLLEQEQALRRRSHDQTDSLVALLAAALPEISADPQEAADRLWRRLERHLNRVNEPHEPSGGKVEQNKKIESSELDHADLIQSRAALADPFIGSWRIREVGEHGRKEIDSSGRAVLTIEKDGGGALRFLGVEAEIDCRISSRSSKKIVDFTWAGIRNGAQISGRGWAHVVKSGDMTGQLFAHREGDGFFKAVKQGPNFLARGRR